MKTPGFAFSHVGLFVHDIGVMEDFYTRVLDFTVTDRGQLPGPDGKPIDLVFTSRDPDEHHQIVLVAGRPAALGFNIINQLSFHGEDLASLRIMHERLAAERVRDLVCITHGNAISVYGLDPEGTRLEFYIDTPWYVTQPTRVPIDFGLDDTALMRNVEAHARSLPGFRPRSEWRAEMAQRMGLSSSARNPR
jgi:catechol 2,3-dioxygenase-like lactoylglutathione lyase family enzyme